MTQRFVAVLDPDAELDRLWLERCLGPDAELLVVADPDARRAQQLVDAGSCGVVLVALDEANVGERAALVEALLAEKPELAVVALGASSDTALILAAMRAGARDFLPLRSEPTALRRAVERMVARAPRPEPARTRGRAYTILCPRPDIITSVFAAHLSLALAEHDGDASETLLIDLGYPDPDSLLFLDLEPSYTFLDAVRSVRRFDETLVRTAFARHASGLAVLPRSSDEEAMRDAPIGDAVALVGVLRSFFRNVVVNLAGIRRQEAIAGTLNAGADVLLVTDQSLVGCRAARLLLEAMSERGTPIDRVRLVVDRHTPLIQPDAERIAEVLGLPLFAVLPASGILTVRAMNSGRSIFDLAPRSPYVKAIRALAAQLAPAPEGEGRRGRLQELLAAGRGRRAGP